MCSGLEPVCLTTSDVYKRQDLGCERRTDYAQGQLFNLINERLLREKKMLVSTNLSSAELRSNYDERIFSRIIGNFTGYSFYGEDLRLTKRVKQN